MQSRKRYDHLRQIERKMQELKYATHEAEASPLVDYEKLTPEEKNKGKYLTTFPYPYMNGYLHLGKY
jgi:leucyl-tRNA synthetase